MYRVLAPDINTLNDAVNLQCQLAVHYDILGSRHCCRNVQRVAGQRSKRIIWLKRKCFDILENFPHRQSSTIWLRYWQWRHVGYINIWFHRRRRLLPWHGWCQKRWYSSRRFALVERQWSHSSWLHHLENTEPKARVLGADKSIRRGKKLQNKIFELNNLEKLRGLCSLEERKILHQVWSARPKPVLIWWASGNTRLIWRRKDQNDRA